MPDEPITTANPDPVIDNSGKGADPSKTEAQNAVVVDVSKLGDDDFNKIFDDPRLYKHPRFKNLNDRAHKADDYEAEKAKIEEETLKKKGEFQTLAEKAQAERDEARNQLAQAKVDNRIQSEIAKAGAVDLEVVLKLIDRTNIKVGEDGSVTGVEEAVKMLLEAKPYLKGTSKPVTMGSATNPGAEDAEGVKKFKRSQLNDAEFWRKNEADIMKAIAAGQVEDDLTK